MLWSLSISLTDAAVQLGKDRFIFHNYWIVVVDWTIWKDNPRSHSPFSMPCYIDFFDFCDRIHRTMAQLSTFRDFTPWACPNYFPRVHVAPAGSKQLTFRNQTELEIMGNGESQTISNPSGQLDQSLPCCFLPRPMTPRSVVSLHYFLSSIRATRRLRETMKRIRCLFSLTPFSVLFLVSYRSEKVRVRVDLRDVFRILQAPI